MTLSGLGRDTDAIQPLEEALAGRRRLLGDAHVATFASLSNLALVRGNVAPADQAIASLAAALVAARALPHLPRATVLGLENNLGATLQDLERNAEAKPHLLAAADLAEKLFDPDHPSVLQIRANLAGVEADLGNPEGASAMYADIARRMSQRVGPDVEATLNARHGQWSSLWRAKQNAAAAAGFTELLTDVTRVLPESHLLNANTRQSLAVALRDAGDFAAALPHAQRAARDFAAQLGEEHPRVKAARALVLAIEAGHAGQ